MNLVTLSLSYIRTQRLTTLLNLLLLALGMATIVILLLFSAQVQERLARDARGIDLVVGAKGSPVQLILSTIYHMDVPVGNIALADAKRLMQNRAVKMAIPLALGDSFRGFRIVGTTADYPEHYGANLLHGHLWQRPMEAVVGATAARKLGLQIGDTFAGAHGIASAGEAHAGTPYTVVGVLAPTASVLDRLILTGVESVWAVHAQHEPSRGPTMPGLGSTQKADAEEEITALLIRYRSPLAAALLPRAINSQTVMQAASPAFETARLLRLLGVGVDALRAFGLLLIFTAGLGVFIALYNALKQRRYDLAIMRTLGASKAKLLWHILSEGLLLVVFGTAAGFVLGHMGAGVLGIWLRRTQQMELSGLVWVTSELWLIGLALGVGVLAAIVPAIQAYRADIASTLAKG